MRLDRIGDRIKFIRKYVSLNQSEFSFKIGTSLSSLVRYEKNQRSPKYETLNSIVEFTGVSSDWLIEGTGEPYSDLPVSKIIKKPGMTEFFDEEELKEVKADEKLTILDLGLSKGRKKTEPKEDHLKNTREDTERILGDIVNTLNRNDAGSYGKLIVSFMKLEKVNPALYDFLLPGDPWNTTFEDAVVNGFTALYKLNVSEMESLFNGTPLSKKKKPDKKPTKKKKKRSKK